MVKSLHVIGATFLISTLVLAADVQQNRRARLDQIEQSLKADVPRILCLDDSFATGEQPSEQAYAKVAASGFRSVVSLRTAAEGVDLKKERSLVEKSGMHYYNIPVASSAPRAEQADEFRRVAKEQSNHPMLVNCASANRVGAFMMIYRVLDQGWSVDKAREEAVKIGLRGEQLEKFAKDYLAQRTAKSK
jgi:protein tyrosine phosphatase (PTP) superfamily phosphohydrolase (DUF442 family)